MAVVEMEMELEMELEMARRRMVVASARSQEQRMMVVNTRICSSDDEPPRAKERVLAYKEAPAELETGLDGAAGAETGEQALLWCALR